MSEQKTPSECLELMMEKIIAVPKERHSRMTIPYEDVMKEAARMTLLAEKYHDRLIVSDIDPLHLDEIVLRAGAFAQCVTVFETHISVNDSHNAQYAEKRKEGFALRRKLMADYAYIFRNDADVLSVLDNIREGRGDLDMIKDLLSLNKLSVDYRDRLEKAHFNFEDSQKAYDLYSELFNLSALRDIDPEKMSEAKLFLVKAWTLLKDTLDEIYAAGRFVFYNEPEIEELFYSDYWQKIREKRSFDGTTGVATPVAPESEPELEPAELQ